MFDEPIEDIRLPWRRIALVAVILIVVLPFGFFLIDSALNQHVYQPVQRQNLNHDADWLRAKTQEVTNLYHDFQTAEASVPADEAAIRQYIATNGDPKTWGQYDARGQVLQQMENKLQGDYQSEITDSQLYNADRDNPDYATVWAQSELANFPQSLQPGPAPSVVG